MYPAFMMSLWFGTDRTSAFNRMSPMFPALSGMNALPGVSLRTKTGRRTP